MLNNLSERVAFCQAKAEACREKAQARPNDREFWSEQEASWLSLAESYDLQRRTSTYLDTLLGPTEQDLASLEARRG